MEHDLPATIIVYAIFNEYKGYLTWEYDAYECTSDTLWDFSSPEFQSTYDDGNVEPTECNASVWYIY